MTKQKVGEVVVEEVARRACRGRDRGDGEKYDAGDVGDAGVHRH